MKNNDFKAINVLNYLINIQFPLKWAHIEVSMTKLDELYFEKIVYWDHNEPISCGAPMIWRYNYFSNIPTYRHKMEKSSTN